MDALFGDATVAPTPATLRGTEAGPLLGVSSPVPSMDLRRGIMGGGVGSPAYSGIGASSAIPGLDIDPPHVRIENGKPLYSESVADGDEGEGMGGWISRMVKRGDGESVRSGRSGQTRNGGNGNYKQVDQDDV